MCSFFIQKAKFNVLVVHFLFYLILCFSFHSLTDDDREHVCAFVEFLIFFVYCLFKLYLGITTGAFVDRFYQRLDIFEVAIGERLKNAEV